jgi:hypothetical protein
MKDQIKTDGMTVQHCPTEQMLADFFSDVLMGYKHMSCVFVLHLQRLISTVNPLLALLTTKRIVVATNQLNRFNASCLEIMLLKIFCTTLIVYTC